MIDADAHFNLVRVAVQEQKTRARFTVCFHTDSAVKFEMRNSFRVFVTSISTTLEGNILSLFLSLCYLSINNNGYHGTIEPIGKPEQEMEYCKTDSLRVPVIADERNRDVIIIDCFVLVAAVLKAAATSAEKMQVPSTPSSEQKASEGTPGYIYIYKPYLLFYDLIVLLRASKS